MGCLGIFRLLLRSICSSFVDRHRAGARLRNSRRLNIHRGAIVYQIYKYRREVGGKKRRRRKKLRGGGGEGREKDLSDEPLIRATGAVFLPLNGYGRPFNCRQLETSHNDSSAVKAANVAVFILEPKLFLLLLLLLLLPAYVFIIISLQSSGCNNDGNNSHNNGRCMYRRRHLCRSIPVRITAIRLLAKGESMTIQDNPWQSMAIHGNPRRSMGTDSRTDRES